MQKTVVINVVGLTPKLIGHDTPFIADWARNGGKAAVEPVLPAVTCSVQSTYLTGVMPREHGIVGNGWYFQDECEVKFWRQSNRLVQHPKIWEKARELDPDFTCANMFWWYNMYSSVDYSATPRPMYPADGRKLPDIWTQPGELRPWLQAELGQFPLFNFWGPKTSIASSRWIAEASMRVEEKHQPTLTLIYLPHLDYCLQRLGPDHPDVGKDLREIDAVVADLVRFYEQRGAQVLILSEYGISKVDTPVYLNRILRREGYIEVREELGRELLDAGASRAFAVADHQIAHVYVQDKAELERIRGLVEADSGVAEVLDREGQARYGLDHPRAGDLVAVAKPNAWFSYYYWLDDARAPDFARCVDIHRKPAYDPVELYVDPEIRVPHLHVARRLLQKKLGMRYLMDVIPLDATLVQGSHGCIPESAEEGPLVITQNKALLPGEKLQATQVYDLIFDHLQGAQSRRSLAAS